VVDVDAISPPPPSEVEILRNHVKEVEEKYNNSLARAESYRSEISDLKDQIFELQRKLIRVNEFVTSICKDVRLV